jgi:hypothetical protein
MARVVALFVVLALALPALARGADGAEKAGKAAEAKKAGDAGKDDQAEKDEGGEPSGRSRAKIGLQAIEARPGKNRTGEGIDAKLAKKLRTTLKLMGLKKPDLKSLGSSSKKLEVGGAISLKVKPYVVEVECKKIDDEKGVTVAVDLYKKKRDKKTKKKKRERMVPCTKVTLNEKTPYHVMTVMQSSEKKTVFVVSR